ncbi:MFS transporter [Brenneria uluponensis]|uniref:MFS transporter n=1 Tax=Brenneria uluponensis TaxID=3057057 RepID=UPI0028E31C28|nr:MFS transporter [Brenneria ulupoensis]
MNDNRMTPTELRATWGLGAVFSLRMLGMFMVLPVLTTYGMALQGANESLIGIAIGIYGLMQAIFQIPLGLMSDRIGRKPLIVGGLLVFALGSVVAALSSSIWGIILGRAMQGSGAISAAVMALLSDLTREQNRTKAMAFIGISFGITFAIAMVIGPIVTHVLGLHALFWGIAVLSGLAIIITLILIPTSSTHILNRESAIVRGNFSKVLTNSRLLKLNAGIMCLHILLMSSFVALPRIMEQAGLAPQNHWKVYLGTMLIAFAAIIPIVIYAEVKRRMKQVFIICILILITAELVLFISGHRLWYIIFGIQLFFLGFNVMEALLPSLISKESPASYKGTAMGVYSTTQFIGVAIGGSLGGALFDLHGAPLVFGAGAVVGIAWLLVSFTMQEPPYLSSLRLTLSDLALQDNALAQKLRTAPGVADVVIVPDEYSAYVKIDNKKTSRQKLEQLLSQC